MSTQAPAVLYVARVKGTDICRIGASVCFEDRFQRLEKHCHREIQLAVMHEIDGNLDQQAVLRSLRVAVSRRGTHLRGDWYRIDANNIASAMTELMLEFKSW